MTAANEVLSDGFDRVRETVHEVVSGLDEDRLGFRPHDHGNSIGWLVWHLTRIQDDHVAGAAGAAQIWTVGGWVERFRLPYDAHATGYGQSSDEDYPRIVDERWDPPVTLAVRLVSVLNDTTQHAGQAAYVRGLLEHRWSAR